MTHPGDIRRAHASAAYLAEHWPALVEQRIPGTARPWRQLDVSTLDPERREQLAAEARAERLDRADLAPGETPAPVDVLVLDLLADITEAADRLAAAVAESARCGLLLPPAPTAYADPTSYLAHLQLHLDGSEYADLVEAAAGELGALARRTAEALRLVYDGQRLAGDCPWCHQPRALVVRVPASEQLPMLVVCESTVVCEPPERDCGKSVRGRPAWPYYEWEWLGDRIRHADAQQRPVAQPAVRSLKIARQPDGCWLWQGADADLPEPDTERSCGQLCLNPAHLRHAEGAA
jgi:hypothetical protein